MATTQMTLDEIAEKILSTHGPLRVEVLVKLALGSDPDELIDDEEFEDAFDDLPQTIVFIADKVSQIEKTIQNFKLDNQLFKRQEDGEHYSVDSSKNYGEIIEDYLHNLDADGLSNWVNAVSPTTMFAPSL